MKRLTVLSVLITILATACSNGDGLEIEDVWARTSANMQDTGAVYMTILGGADDDALIGASVSSTVATGAQLHQTAMTEADDGSDMMMMEPVASVDIPASDEISFEPGGYHVMLTQLAEPLVNGSEFTVTLIFEGAGDKEVTVQVQEQ